MRATSVESVELAIRIPIRKTNITLKRLTRSSHV